MATCPVCGMFVDEKTARFKSDYQGKTYYFCSPVDMNAFNANPARYAK